LQLASWYCGGEIIPGSLDRKRLLSALQAQPGLRLVVVRYLANHDVNNEWVYNEADIDRSKVVWARDTGAAKNSKLLDYWTISASVRCG
jgi:hypothetical protein